MPETPPRSASSRAPIRGPRSLSSIGPGLLLAATGVGVGDMVSSTIAGAEYGLTLVWAVAVGVIVKFAITEGLARWQLVTGTSLLEGWRDHLPPAIVLAFFLYFVVWSYFVSSALVAASALAPAAVMPWLPLPAWGLVHALAAFGLVYAGRYEQVLAVAKWLIALMLVALLVAVALILGRSGADWTALTGHAAFSVPYALSLIGGIGGTVTLLSYGYWMREEGWSGATRIRSARIDLTVSFALAFVFALSMMFLSSQIEWSGSILEEGPRLALLLADRIAVETGPIGRAVFLLGFWGAAFSSVVGVWHGVPFLFDDWIHTWRRQAPTGQRGRAYRGWAVYLTLAAISALFIGRPVKLVFAYTIVGSLFFPFVIATLLWMNNSALLSREARNGVGVNAVLGGALLLYAYLMLDVVVGALGPWVGR
jgi:Mn2+/Fe2+ NRAMP family transporter